MNSLDARIPEAFPVGACIPTCDNSGAKMIEVISVYGYKGVKRRKPQARIGDLIKASVKKGRPDMIKQMVFAVIVRQKKEFRRPDGTRIKFQDNAAVVLKDDKGNPKGTIFKGPIAKEVSERWPSVAKVARIVV